MRLLHSIVDLFLENFHETSATETFKFAESKFQSDKFRKPSAAALKKIFEALPAEDNFTISLNFESASCSINSRDLNHMEEFLQEYNSYVAVAESGDLLTAVISINKAILDGKTSLYSVETFAKTLGIKSLSEVFGVFGEVAKSEVTLAIRLYDESPEFNTRTIAFWSKNPPSQKQFLRAEVRAKRNDVAHFDAEDFRVIPEDFHLIERSPNQDMNGLFDRLCFASSMTFLADVSTFKIESGKENLWVKVNGYKTIASNVDISAVDSSTASELFNIYEWVYSPGGLSDKIGIARNILSLYWKNGVSNPIEPGIFNSIRSGFEIYLRQNVRQYIEIKNKLSDFLVDFSQKAAKLAENFGDKFEKNFGAFIGFFISSVIVKVVTDKTFTGVFTRPLGIIGLTIIGFSALHLIATLWIFNKDKTRLGKDFENLKKRYEDLLDAKDLDQIFNKTGGFSELRDYLTLKRNIFAGVWTTSILVFLVLVYSLTNWQPSLSAESSATTNSEVTRTNIVASQTNSPQPVALSRSNNIVSPGNLTTNVLLKPLPSAGPKTIYPTNKPTGAKPDSATNNSVP